MISVVKEFKYFGDRSRRNRQLTQQKWAGRGGAARGGTRAGLGTRAGPGGAACPGDSGWPGRCGLWGHSGWLTLLGLRKGSLVAEPPRAGGKPVGVAGGGRATAASWG